MFVGDPPTFLRRTPHGYHEVDEVCADLAAAGFELIEVDTITRRGVASSARDAVLAFCGGTPLRNQIEARDATRLEEAVSTSAAAVAALFGDGEVEGKIQAHVVVAT